jgi:hypothetical protein
LGQLETLAYFISGAYMAEATTGEMKPTLGLTGLTSNAMALIAPGAFLCD